MAVRKSIRALALGTFLLSCHAAVAPGRAPSARAERAQPLPLSSSARLARANQRFDQSAYREAEADFRALAGTPEASQAALGLGQVLVTTGRYAEAARTLGPLLSEPELGISAAVWLARAERGAGDLRAAEK